MKKTGIIFGLLLFAFCIPIADALGVPDVTFIPAGISANSSFLMLVDPHATGSESVRVTWTVPGFAVTDHGLVPKVGEKWICYFSNQDPTSTCGPNPFRQKSVGLPYTLLIDAVNQFEQVQNKTLNVTVGGITLTLEILVDENLVYIKAWASAPVDGISYKTYKADTLELVTGKSGNLEYFSPISGYVGNLTLNEGDYFIAFSASSMNDFGGGLGKISVSTVENGGDGNVTYKVKADEIVWSPVIKKNQHYEVTRFRITNIGTENLTNLKAEVPSNLSYYLSVTLANTSLEPNGSMYYTVAIDNIAESMSIETYVSLYSGATLLTQIPASIKVTVKGDGGVEFCEGKQDGTYCNGGVCCVGSCRAGWECCDDNNCREGEKCENNKCIVVTTTCLRGLCYNGTSCPIGKTPTGQTCKIGEMDGVCCEEENECAGKPDGEACSSGVCCNEICVECCTDDDCPSNKECSNNVCVSISKTCSEGICYETCPDGMSPTGETCTEGSISGVCCKTGGEGEFDITPIIIIILLVVAGLGGFLAFKKFRKKGEEEFPEEEGFEEEDFY